MANIENAQRIRTLHSRTLTRLGYAHWKLKRKETAFRCYEQALSIYRELKDREGEASVSEDKASAYSMSQQDQQAIDLYQQALAIERELKDRAGEAKTLRKLGYSYRNLRQRENAVRCYEQALVIWRELKERTAEASTLSDLAFVYWIFDDYEKAVDWYEQALAIQRDLKDLAGEAATLPRLAFAYRKANRIDTAVQSYERMLAIHRELKNRAAEAEVLADLGFTYWLASEYEKSIKWYEQALAIYRELNNSNEEAETLSWLGSAYARLERYEKAISYHEQTLALRRNMKDRAGEASALNFLADHYTAKKQYDKAMALYAQTLAIRRELQDQPGEVTTLNSLGEAYHNQTKYEEAIKHFEQALAIAEVIKKANSVAYAFSGLGKASVALNQDAKAIKYYEQALAVHRAVKDTEGQTRDLNALGFIYARLSANDKAFAAFEQALQVAREAKDRKAEGVALTTLGFVYQQLKQSDKALEYFDRALTIAREVKSRPAEGAVLGTVGIVYYEQRQYQKAIDSFNQGLVIAREMTGREAEAGMLIGLGFAYNNLKQQEKALDYFEQSLSIARQLKMRSGEVPPITGLSQVYFDLKQYDKAAYYCDQALMIAREVKNREGEASVLGMSMAIWKEKKQPKLAIILGKRSINILQEIRNELRDVDQALQQSFVQGKREFYRQLADLLAGQGRIPEAQQVLGMLKEQEYFEFVRRDADAGSLKAAQINFTTSEAEVQKQFFQISNQLTALGAERGGLLSLNNRTPEQEKRLSELESQLETANQAFQKFIDQLDVELRKDSGDRNATAIRESQALMETLRELSSVAVYTIVGKDKYRAILITPDVQKAYEYSISESDLNRRVNDFREVLQNPNLDPLPLAQELYRILIGPELARDIAQTNTSTIMWSLDGTLRYLPIAALHDGQKYTVESYRNVLFTLASRDHLKDPVSPKWHVLGLGVSREREVAVGESKSSYRFPALPGVREELSGIVRQQTTPGGTGLLDGTVLLDESFTAEALRNSLRLRGGEQPYKLVHIASHFNFQPGDESKSFLLLGDGTLTLARLKAMSNLFSKVELLTLSACNTATGDSGGEGKEVEGFAVLAQRQGAEAIIATLWPVSDPSTSQLMQHFYRLREATAGTSKAEALRQAQLALLRGSLDSVPGANNTRATLAVAAGNRSASSSYVKDPRRPFAHPYYWAPFILIGNWR